MKNTWYVILFGIAAILLVMSWPTMDQYLNDLDTNWYVNPTAIKGKNMVDTGAAMDTGTVVDTGAAVDTGTAAAGTGATDTGAAATTGA